jgi:hypothetical protein
LAPHRGLHRPDEGNELHEQGVEVGFQGFGHRSIAPQAMRGTLRITRARRFAVSCRREFPWPE